MAARFLEIDALRGLAIIVMIAFHFIFDYNFFISTIANLSSGFWFVVGRVAAVVFVLLAGLSMVLHAHRKNLHAYDGWRVMVRRGIFVFALGLVVSLVTFMVFPANAIWFGVLHLIGLSLILGIPFIQNSRAALAAGAVITLAGVAFSTVLFSSLPFWPILLPVVYPTFDYFPIFPWLGVFLLGMGAAGVFYPKGVAHARLGWTNGNVLVHVLAALGRKSLVIYFIHQPILLGIIWVLKSM